MPISHDKRVLFIHVPKTGGTTISKILGIPNEKTLNPKDLVSQRRYLVGDLGLHEKLRHLTYDEILEGHFFPKKTIDSYFKFGFVRNTWDRFISGYCHDMGVWYPNITDHRFGVEDLERYLHQEVNQFFWRPQVRYIYSGGRCAMDFVGRFENMESDWIRLCDMIGLKSQTKSLIRVIRVRHGSKRRHKDYRRYFNDDTRKFVAKIYQEDIETFGYKF